MVPEFELYRINSGYGVVRTLLYIHIMYKIGRLKSNGIKVKASFSHPMFLVHVLVCVPLPRQERVALTDDLTVEERNLEKIGAVEIWSLETGHEAGEFSPFLDTRPSSS